jgi:hypothetical protein
MQKDSANQGVRILEWPRNIVNAEPEVIRKHGQHLKPLLCELQKPCVTFTHHHEFGCRQPGG